MRQPLDKPLIESIDLPLPHSVAFFGRVVRNVLNEFGPSVECWLMSMCRMNRFTSVEKVLEDITMRYTHAGGTDRLLAELQSSNKKAGKVSGGMDSA